MISKELREFYRVILEAVEKGDPNGLLSYQSGAERRGRGLCGAMVRHYFPRDGLGVSRQKSDEYYEIAREQRNLFIKETGTGDYPFNLRARSYVIEWQACTLYENPERLAWLKKYAQEGS